MKTRTVAGLTALAAGLAVLSLNFGWFKWNVNWTAIWNFWPVLLILLGLIFLLPVRFKKIAAWLSAVGLCILIFAGVGRLNDGWQRIPRGVVTQTLASDVSAGIAKASLEFDSGAGEFAIGGSTDKLLAAETQSSIGQYRLDEAGSGDSRQLRLIMESGGYFRLGRNLNKAQVSLNSSPVWDLAVNVGAASGNFDLSGYKVEKTVIRSGASSLALKLSDLLPDAWAEVDTGASSVKIFVPRSAGVEINAGTGLVSKNFQGLRKVSDKLYQTEGFAEAGKKIHLTMRAGASSIEVSQY